MSAVGLIFAVVVRSLVVVPGIVVVVVVVVVVAEEVVPSHYIVVLFDLFEQHNQPLELESLEMQQIRNS